MPVLLVPRLPFALGQVIAVAEVDREAAPEADPHAAAARAVNTIAINHTNLMSGVSGKLPSTMNPASFTHPIDVDAVRRSAAIIDGVAHRTPVFRSRTLDGLCGGEVLLKAENLQRGGAFKFRGAYTALAAMDPDQRAAGVVAFSSGNHAQAVAISARLWETRATIVMPADAPAGKLAATRGYGAEVITYDRATEDREAIARELGEQRGLTVIPPFELPAVMAGQGTAALELIESDGPLDVLIAPIGGGGLMAGCATVAKGLLPSVRVIGVEPEAGDDTRRSMTEGHPVGIDLPKTIADGLQTTRPGDMTFEINRRLVDAIELVSDAEIVAAMVFLFERLKLVVEPSGAVGVAAILSGRLDINGARGRRHPLRRKRLRRAVRSAPCYRWSTNGWGTPRRPSAQVKYVVLPVLV